MSSFIVGLDIVFKFFSVLLFVTCWLVGCDEEGRDCFLVVVVVAAVFVETPIAESCCRSCCRMSRSLFRFGGGERGRDFFFLFPRFAFYSRESPDNSHFDRAAPWHGSDTLPEFRTHPHPPTLVAAANEAYKEE